VRAASAALIAHLGGTGRTLATCWRVERTDGQVFGFTSHDRDLVFESVTYVASTGITRSVIQGRTGLAVDNLEVTGFFDSAAIDSDDLDAGVWDYAEVRVFDVNWADLSMGQLRQLRGWTGEVSREGSEYKAELRGLGSALNARIGELVGPGCAAARFDTRCGVSPTDYTATGAVTAVINNRDFDTDLATSTVRLTPSTTGNPTLDYFAAGMLTWLTGPNAGRRIEVKSYAVDGSVVLQLPMAGTVASGNTFSVRAGCTKARAFCASRFGNVVRFRGFPDLPGLDRVMRIGGQ